MSPTSSPDEAPAASPPDAPTPEALRALRERAQTAFEHQRDNAQRLEERLEECLARVAGALSEEASAGHDERLASVDETLREFHQQREAFEADVASARADINAQRDQIAREAERQAAERESLEAAQRELADRQAEAERAQAELAEREREQSERDQQLNVREQKCAEREEREAQESSAPLEKAERRAVELSEELEQAREALAIAEQQLGVSVEESQGLREDLSRTSEALAQAEARLSDTQPDAALQEKFELALADVQEHRQRIDQLEQELASRPEADAAESAELLRMREERDELLARVERLELEAHQAPADGGEEVADLQRRFELAVEDVRQLKKDKEDLERQLAEAAGASAGDDGAMDWEAQKRRLIANLEGEPEDVTPERAQERATVEGTIKITDQVVAEKDREIEVLRQQLAESREASAAAPAEPAAPPLDDDERLEAERARLAQLKEQWREKLRQAELEVSVERAKIARERTELEEWRVDLEALRDSLPIGGQSAPGEGPSKRERNWLRKLGLGGDE